MTKQQLIEEIKQLSVADRVTLIEAVLRSLREDLVTTKETQVAECVPAATGQPTLSQRLRGIVKFDGEPPTDEEVKDAYTDYLVEKYS